MNAEIARSILVKLKKTEDVIINKFESDVRSVRLNILKKFYFVSFDCRI